MADSHRLLRRNGTYYYRRRVPLDLVVALGKTVIQYTLQTSDLKEAKRLREVADIEWSARFAAATNGPVQSNGVDDRTAKSISKSGSDLTRLVIDYVAQTDARYRQRLADDPPESEAQKAEMIQDAEIDLQILGDRDDPRGVENVEGTTKLILREAGRSSEQVKADAASAELVRRALLELDRRRLAYLADDHGQTHFDKLFSPLARAETTFGEVAQQYLRLAVEESTANGRSRKWIDKQTASVALVREIVGDATPIRAVNYDMCLHVRTTLARIPTNRSKLYGGLSLKRAIDRGEVEGRPTLSPQTQQAYLAAFKDILDLATKKQLIPVNPAEGLTPLKRDTVSASEKRAPFTSDQLVQFFKCDFYRRCVESGRAPYQHDKSGWRFWLPLICLFMGMRPNEVCQLAVDDIRQTEQGTCYAQVAPGVDDETGVIKTIKTASSRRRIPIHPELIKIGLLSYVEDRRAAKKTMLFDIKPDKYSNYAAYPLKRFRDHFFPAAIKLESRQSFYSFRHNFRDALRRIGAPPDVLQALGGWSHGKNVSDDYGDKSNPDYQVQFIEKVAFSGLDLSHLYNSNTEPTL